MDVTIQVIKVADIIYMYVILQKMGVNTIPALQIHST